MGELKTTGRQIGGGVIVAVVVAMTGVAAGCTFEGAPGTRPTVDASPRPIDARVGVPDARPDATSPANCSSYDDPFDSSVYLLEVGDFTRQAAEDFCAGTGGTLVDIDSDQENTHVAAIIRSSAAEFPTCVQADNPCVWLGLSQLSDQEDVDEGWRWLDGDDPFDEGQANRFAGPNQPDDANNEAEDNQENCAVLEVVPVNPNLNRWWDQPCTGLGAVLCECPAPL